MALLPATSARKALRLTFIWSAICSRFIRPHRHSPARSAMPSVRMRTFSNCTWPPTKRANRFRATSAAKTLRANTIWIVTWSSLAVMSHAKSNSCRVRCATKCSRGWTICVNTCECIWGSRPGAGNTSVHFVRRSFTGRRC